MEYTTILHSLVEFAEKIGRAEQVHLHENGFLTAEGAMPGGGRFAITVTLEEENGGT